MTLLQQDSFHKCTSVTFHSIPFPALPSVFTLKRFTTDSIERGMKMRDRQTERETERNVCNVSERERKKDHVRG